MNSKLDQLTSMRFFAALSIVILHLTGLFGVKTVGLNLGIAVSFFFVLSGFILTYAYKSFDSSDKVIDFFKARFARIFPVYIFSLILFINLLPIEINLKTLIPYIFMIQGWIPDSNYFFSYNGPAWSISTEFFFYICFPILLMIMNKAIYKVLIPILCVFFLLLYISNFFPSYIPPLNNDFSGINFSQLGLLYINPISRILEFIIGMSMAIIFRNPINVTKSQQFIVFSMLEISVLFLSIFSTLYGKVFLTDFLNLELSQSFNTWYSEVGLVLPFAIFIFIFAHGNGVLSKILSLKPFVLLGEISFSMYLIHQIFIRYYGTYSQQFISFNDTISLLIYFFIVLVSSYLIWTYIEIPSRKIILGKQKIHGNIHIVYSNFKNIISIKFLIDMIFFLVLILLIKYIHL